MKSFLAPVVGVLLAGGLTAAPAQAAMGDFPVTGTVRYVDGSPVAGACVQFKMSEPPDASGFSRQKPLAYQITDASGTFSFTPPQAGEFYVFFRGIDPACSLDSYPTGQFYVMTQGLWVAADGTVGSIGGLAKSPVPITLVAAPADRVYIAFGDSQVDCMLYNGDVIERWSTSIDERNPPPAAGTYTFSLTATDASGATIITKTLPITTGWSTWPSGMRTFTGTPYGAVTFTVTVTAPDGTVTTDRRTIPQDTSLCTSSGTGIPTTGDNTTTAPAPAIRVSTKRSTATGYLSKHQVRRVKLQRLTTSGAWKTVKTKKTSSKSGRVKYYRLKKGTQYRLYAPLKTLNGVRLPAAQSRTFTR